jgi:hypothetical protein
MAPISLRPPLERHVVFSQSVQIAWGITVPLDRRPARATSEGRRLDHGLSCFLTHHPTTRPGSRIDYDFNWLGLMYVPGYGDPIDKIRVGADLAPPLLDDLGRTTPAAEGLRTSWVRAFSDPADRPSTNRSGPRRRP